MTRPRSEFLIALCPVCAIPWPTYSREDLRLMEHDRIANKGEAPTRRMMLSYTPLVLCSGSGRVLDVGEYGENGDDRFAPGG